MNVRQIKVWSSVFVGAVLLAILFVFTSYSEVRQKEQPQGKLLQYENKEFALSFLYPAGWNIEERVGGKALHLSRDEFLNGERQLPLQPDNIAEDDSDPSMKFAVLLDSPSNEMVGITVFPKPSNFGQWLKGKDQQAFEEGRLHPDRPNAVVNGRKGYVWRGHENSTEGVMLVFLGDKYLYQAAYFLTTLDQSEIEEIIASISTGVKGETVLPPDIVRHGPKDTSTTTSDVSILAASCSNCGETDAYLNAYPCCTNFGNCTWKTEEQRAGDNNFYFGGVSGRNAYRWMTLAKDYTSYATGGTMPEIGAVLVTTDDLGGLGHVATVTSMNSDGSVTVREQNCDLTCTRLQTYNTAWILRYIAGFIYNGSSTPTPTPKVIASSGETIIEDYNFSNVYNFSTYGPGSKVSFNGGERAWGTSTAGRNGAMHFILSKASPYENYGRWRASIQQGGYYEVQAWIPNTTLAAATSVKYDVGGTLSTAINQSTTRNTWVQVRNPNRADGYWNFASVGSYSIFLADNYASTANQYIAMDAIKLIRR